MTGKFGFDEPLNFEGLPVAAEKKGSIEPDDSFQKDARSLGFTDRSVVKKSKPKPLQNRKPGRKPPVEPKSSILISGPISVISSFKDYCDANGNVPYWEAIKILLENDSG